MILGNNLKTFVVLYMKNQQLMYRLSKSLVIRLIGSMEFTLGVRTGMTLLILRNGAMMVTFTSGLLNRVHNNGS